MDAKIINVFGYKFILLLFLCVNGSAKIVKIRENFMEIGTHGDEIIKKMSMVYENIGFDV